MANEAATLTLSGYPDGVPIRFACAEETGIEKRCIWCNTSLRRTNRTKICYECRQRNNWKQKYEKLEKEFERHKEICERVLLSYHKKLRKSEPNITWDEEPE